MEPEEFKELYFASGARMMMGVATDSYRDEIARRREAEMAAAGL
jgi:hypothetical protein